MQSRSVARKWFVSFHCVSRTDFKQVYNNAALIKFVLPALSSIGGYLSVSFILTCGVLCFYIDCRPKPRVLFLSS